MYERIRQIHLFAAFVLMVFVLMYFISGFVMIYEETFDRKDISVMESALKIPGIGITKGDTLVSTLKEKLAVRGQYQIRGNASVTTVNFRHPGTEVKVVIDNASDSVTYTVRKKNFVAILHQFHRLHGYEGGWNYNLWAFAYDLSAASMIIFAFTGVYLWYETERTKWPGWLTLAAFTMFTAYTLYYLAYLN
jgi:hypothetical protein